MTVDMGCREIWAAYVRRITGDTTQKEIADRTGVNQTTISRWLRATNDPSHAGNVAALAIEYGRNPLEAFVAAGLLELDVALRGLDQDSLDLLAEVEGGRPSRRSPLIAGLDPAAKQMVPSLLGQARRHGQDPLRGEPSDLGRQGGLDDLECRL